MYTLAFGMVNLYTPAADVADRDAVAVVGAVVDVQVVKDVAGVGVDVDVDGVAPVGGADVGGHVAVLDVVVDDDVKLAIAEDDVVGAVAGNLVGFARLKDLAAVLPALNLLALEGSAGEPEDIILRYFNLGLDILVVVKGDVPTITGNVINIAILAGGVHSRAQAIGICIAGSSVVSNIVGVNIAACDRGSESTALDGNISSFASTQITDGANIAVFNSYVIVTRAICVVEDRANSTILYNDIRAISGTRTLGIYALHITALQGKCSTCVISVVNIDTAPAISGSIKVKSSDGGGIYNDTSALTVSDVNVVNGYVA